MTWPGQNPPATDVILHLNVPCAGHGPDKLTYLEIDKLPDGTYRATGGSFCSAVHRSTSSGSDRRDRAPLRTASISAFASRNSRRPHSSRIL